MFKTFSNRRSVGLTAFSTLALLVSLVNQSAASIFVTDLIDGINSLPIPGNQAWAGQLGDDFTTGTNGITITAVGGFDDDGDGTAGSLVWQLFNVTTGALVHSETIAASGARTPGSTINDNYVWKSLGAPLYLAPSTTYSAVAYGFDSVDKNFNTNLNPTTLDVVFNTLDLTAAGGRYSSGTGSTLPTTGAGNTASTQAYNFGAATFDYQGGVPEPTTFVVWSLLGLAGTYLWRRKTGV